MAKVAKWNVWLVTAVLVYAVIGGVQSQSCNATAACGCLTSSGCAFCPTTGNCAPTNDDSNVDFCPGTIITSEAHCYSFDYVRLSSYTLLYVNVTLTYRSSIFALVDLTAPIQSGTMFQVYIQTYDDTIVPCYASRQSVNSLPSAAQHSLACYPFDEDTDAISFAASDPNFVRDTYAFGFYLTSTLPYSFQIGVRNIPNPGSQFLPNGDSIRYYILFSVLFAVACGVLALSLRRFGYLRRTPATTAFKQEDMVEKTPRLHVLWLNDPLHENQDTLDGEAFQYVAKEVYPNCTAYYHVVRVPSVQAGVISDVEIAARIVYK